MGLTSGTGPFGKQPAGAFNFERPRTEGVIYFEPSPRRMRGLLGGETVVDSRHAMLLHEHGKLPVYYYPEDEVRMDLLEPTDHTSHCPWKGDASYWTVRVGDRVAENAAWGYPDPLPDATEEDVAWFYRDPRHDAARVKDYIAFFNERVDLYVDGELQERPETQWSPAVR